jgi:hypothetical protein
MATPTIREPYQSLINSESTPNVAALARQGFKFDKTFYS